MTLIPVNSRLRRVFGINEHQKASIDAFLRERIDRWIENHEGEAFAVPNLVGGENWDWDGTPLQVLYNKHREAGKETELAFRAAGRDCGWLLKAILNTDRRAFQIEHRHVNYYRPVDDQA